RLSACRVMSVLDGFEAIARTDRCDFQMQVGQPGVAAVIDKVFRGLVLIVNLHELDIVSVVFTKMSTDAALTFVNMKHGSSPVRGN
ncbi:MAG: hypothetical protein KDA90_04955, partial [Planctomycetaceae bacterium]|nr:hypothetical protein [Planctomycetaceae bacterium]